MGLWIEIGFGLVLLFAGGEALVRGSVGVARRAGVPSFLIGLTLVGFGTSTPELVTSLDAALSGVPGVALGNVVGSNIANVLLIVGVAAVITPIAAAPGVLGRDGWAMVAASAAALAVVLTGGVGRVAGIVFLAALAAYLWISVRAAGAEGESAADAPPPGSDSGSGSSAGSGPVWQGLALAGAGIAGVILGADLLVSGSVTLARQVGLSEAVIGLTLVAVGTSLPELATSAIAALRRQGDIALGNVIGSNLFNLLGILGATAVVSPLPVPAQIMALDIWVMMGTALLLLGAAWTGRRIGRVEGAAFLIGYAAYLALLLVPPA